MLQLTLLRAALQPHLPWHWARLTLIAEFLIALFRVKTVNLTELATGFGGQALPASAYKRWQRFLRDYELDGSGMGASDCTLDERSPTVDVEPRPHPMALRNPGDQYSGAGRSASGGGDSLVLAISAQS